MSTYTGFKSSIAALRVAPAAASAQPDKDKDAQAMATTTRPISPPESDASSVDGTDVDVEHKHDSQRWVEDWDGGMHFAPITEARVSRGVCGGLELFLQAGLSSRLTSERWQP